MQDSHQNVPRLQQAGYLAGQECCGDNREWNFRARYREVVMSPRWKWDFPKIQAFQNVIADGGSTVKDNVLKRQETYGVAFALVLGCSIGVLAAIANQMGPQATCSVTTIELLKTECMLQQLFAGTAIGASILVEIIVLNNIAFVSGVASMHVAYTIDNYQWLFSIPSVVGIPLTLMPLCFERMAAFRSLPP